MFALYTGLFLDLLTQIFLFFITLYQYRERNQENNGLRGLKNALLAIGVICVLNKFIAIAQGLTRISAEPAIVYQNANIAWQNIAPKVSWLIAVIVVFFIYQKNNFEMFTVKYWKEKFL